MNKMIKMIMLLPVFFMGCKYPQCERPEFNPLPPEKLNDLLLRPEANNWAYKSVTKKDYECEEEC